MTPPRFYPILDSDFLARRRLDPLEVAEALAESGAAWVQFRHKAPYNREAYDLAGAIGRVVQRAGAKYVINDRADIALMLGADGVHVGQDDLPPSAVRKLVRDRLFIGYSTHNEAQLRAAEAEPVDYLALGPIFGTQSKANPDKAVGVDELRRLRPLTARPLTAIGGITIENVGQVYEAGADSAALISDFLQGDWRRSLARWF